MSPGFHKMYTLVKVGFSFMIFGVRKKGIPTPLAPPPLQLFLDLPINRLCTMPIIISDICERFIYAVST